MLWFGTARATGRHGTVENITYFATPDHVSPPDAAYRPAAGRA